MRINFSANYEYYTADVTAAELEAFTKVLSKSYRSEYPANNRIVQKQDEGGRLITLDLSISIDTKSRVMNAKQAEAEDKVAAEQAAAKIE